MKSSPFKAGRVTAVAVVAAFLSTVAACGGESESPPAAQADTAVSQPDVVAPATGSAPEAGGGSDSSLLGIATKQLVKTFKAADGRVEGKTLILTFNEELDDSRLLSICQIAPSVMEGIATGEITDYHLETASGVKTCEEVLE